MGDRLRALSDFGSSAARLIGGFFEGRCGLPGVGQVLHRLTAGEVTHSGALGADLRMVKPDPSSERGCALGRRFRRRGRDVEAPTERFDVGRRLTVQVMAKRTRRSGRLARRGLRVARLVDRIRQREPGATNLGHPRFGPQMRPSAMRRARMMAPIPRPAVVRREVRPGTGYVTCAMEPRSAETPQRTLAQRIGKVLRDEFGPLHLRLLIAGVFVRFLPHLAFQRVRTVIYRCAGISIGPRSLLAGPLALIGPGPITSRLRIGSDCWFNSPLFADLTGTVDIGDSVTIGHHVVFITANHRIGPARRRAGVVEADGIRIGDGAWIGAGVMLLPGASVGAGSVIGAGSLVTAAVPPGVVAVGRPARVIRSIDEEHDAELLAGPARRARA